MITFFQFTTIFSSQDPPPLIITPICSLQIKQKPLSPNQRLLNSSSNRLIRKKINRTEPGVASKKPSCRMKQVSERDGAIIGGNEAWSDDTRIDLKHTRFFFLN